MLIIFFTEKNKKSKGVTLSFQEFSAQVDGNTTAPAGGNVVYTVPSKKLGTTTMSSCSADEVDEDG